MKVPFKKQNLESQNVVKKHGWFKQNKRNLIGVGSVVLILITLAITVATMVLKKKTTVAFSTITPELARAMEYDVLEDEEQEVEGTDGNVEFGAFFLRDITGDNYAERLKGTCKEIGTTDTLYMEINVKTGGKLTNGKIEIQGTNFALQTALPEDDQLKTSYIGNDIKVIEFKELLNGTQKMIDGVIKSSIGSYTTKDYSRDDNKIIFTGTYIDEDEVEHEITKEIPLAIDWYGTTSASIYSTSQVNRDLPDRIDEENGTLKLSFSINTTETKSQLNLSKNHVEGTIPKLQDYLPTAVRLTSSQTNTVFDYDEDTGEFTIDRTAVVTEEGEITSTLSRYNTYTLEVTYPIDAYYEIGADTVTLRIPTRTQYEGFNNPNGQFTSPHKSNVASTTIVANFSNPVGEVANIFITVGKYMYSPTYRYIVSKQKPLRIYNELSSEEHDDTYVVRWEAVTGTITEPRGFILKETKNEEQQKVDQFIKTGSTRESMEDVTTNVGIYFSGADNLLGEDGWIRVYDEETGNLVGEFSKDNWNKYTESNPYKYETPVKHIRVETSEVIKENSLYVYNIKELNDEVITTKYDRDAFDNLQYIESTLTGYLGSIFIATKTNQANYEAPYSIATISISKNTLSTQVTEENDKIIIHADYSVSLNQVGWIDGSFLIKLPTEISEIDINSVEIDNSQVTIINYELIENEEGKFIKINTKNKIDQQQAYDITINANITPDPRIATVTRSIELYASNKESCDYYYKEADKYDVNDNLNKDEKVNKTEISINLVSPNSLLANQTISEFDNNGTEIVSPQIADIKPIYVTLGSQRQTVKIGVQIKNNYSSAIGEIKLLGRIPFEGNTYAISKKEMNSNFSTTMTDKGIELPPELEGKVKVYYSDNPTADSEVGKTENNWQEETNVKRWEDIKSFLIDFEDEKLAEQKEYVFYYTVNMPEEKDLNKVSYSHFGVYFTLETEQGKYKTRTESNKIGIRIADKYDLELKKYQKGRDNLVTGATYVVREILDDGNIGTTKTATTNDDGILEIKDLYAEKTYEIQEIKTPDDYEINEDVIKFIGHVDKQTGKLTITKESGTTRNDKNIEVTQNDDKNKITIEVEDEVKAKLKIVKQEKNTTIKMQNVKFKITGEGLAKQGKVIRTNNIGEIEVKGLKINEEYTLEETQSKGYYLLSPIKFKITNNEGIYQFEKIEEEGNGEVKENRIDENNGIPTLTLTLEDEKIPRYSLDIIKIKRITETTLSTDELMAKAYANLSDDEVEPLQGAKFKLYKGTEEIGTYETKEDGKVTIDDLYLYVDGKDEEASYTLKEVLSPTGYAKVKNITFKAEIVEGELKLINIDGTEEEYVAEGNNKIKLLIQDSPSFKLIKKDAEEQTPLANIKFAIYNVDDGEEPARNSKGEIIGNKETINGKEYYTLTTNNVGEITEDLPEGLYKAVEVDAPDQYDISNATYYFGIGASREGRKVPEAEWGKAIGGTDDDYITSIAETSDGGYIVGGYFSSSSIDLGGTAGKIIGNNTTVYNPDGMIIKYDSKGNAEWGKTIGGTSGDYINSVATTSDEGYIVGGYFVSGSIDLGETAGTITCSGSYDGMIIKLDSEGNAEWGKAIGGTSPDYISSVAETSDGSYIVGGRFGDTIDLGGTAGTITSNGSSDGMIIKLDSKGEAEWGKAIGGTDFDQITTVTATSDRGYIVGGYFESESIDLGGKAGTITITSNDYYDGMIIKLDSNGEAEWGKAIGGTSSDQITSVAETSDGGYIVGGYFTSETIDLGGTAGTIIGNNTNSTNPDGMIIKLDSKGNAKWGKAIGGTREDRITSIAETRDGGYIVGGYFKGTINLAGTAGTITNTEYGSRNGMIIKCDVNGNAEWGKAIGGTEEDQITSLVETKDGGYIVGGYFESREIDLGGTAGIITSNGSQDGMIIKLEIKEIPEVIIKQGKAIGGTEEDQITSLVETKDGGCIVGGYFLSKSIDLGTAGIITNNSKKNIYDEYYSDGMIIKYDKEGNVEWGKAIGGTFGDYINSVVETSDGGYIVGGYFSNSIYLRGTAGTITSNGSSDGMIIKLDSNGEAEWGKAIGGTDSDYIQSIVETSNGGYIVGGDFGSSIINLGGTAGTIIGNNTSKYAPDGMIIKLDSKGEAEWGKAIGGEKGDKITSVEETSGGGYIVRGRFYGSIDLGGTAGTITNNGSTSYYDGMIIKLDNKGEAEWGKAIGGANVEDEITSVAETTDRGYIVGGHFGGSIDLGGTAGKITSNGSQDGMIIKYDSEGNAEWGKAIGGTSSDQITSVAETTDGGYIVGGDFGSSINLVGTITSNGSSDGMIIKYDENGEVKWGQGIGGTGSECINSIAETSDGGYIVGGYIVSGSIDLGEKVGTITCSGSYDGMILKVMPEIGVLEVQELTVENKIKEFKITTEVKKVNGIKGGTISGEGKIYEKVKYGDSNTLNIEMKTEPGYEISLITINGVEQKFTPKADNSYVLEAPFFTDMKEDKHIVVSFVEKDKKAVIIKEDSKTHEKLSGATFKLNQVEEGSDAEDLYHTEVTTNINGEGIIPNLPYGKYKITETKAPEGYVINDSIPIADFSEGKERTITIQNEKAGKVTVQHLFKDNNQPVAEEDHLEGKVGDPYSTKPHLDLKEYEIEKKEDGSIKLPEGAVGEYEDEDRVVTYYYVKKEIPLIVHHYVDGTCDPVELDDGSKAPDVTDSGKEGEPYTTTALENLADEYKLSSTPANAQGTYEYEKVEVTYYYDVKQFNVTTKVRTHGETNLMGEEEQVRGGDILGEKESPYETVLYGESNTREITATPEEGYSVKSIEINERVLEPDEYTILDNGKIRLNTIEDITEDIEVVVEFEPTPAEVLVHHYVYDDIAKEGTTINIADDVTMKGFVGREYTTYVAEVPANYECMDDTPDKYQGTYAEEKIVVIYYYKVKDPTLENTIEKEATANKTDKEGNTVLTQKDGIVTYNIRYTVNVDRYIGKATIEIVDTLPAKIDTEAEGTDLQSGEYSESNNTITWKQDIIGIDTYSNEESENIVIEKTIKVVYKEQDINSDLTNIVTGTTKLYYPDNSNKPGEELKTKEITDEETVKQEYKKEVTVEKIWDYRKNQYDHPIQVELQVKNKDQIVAKYTVTEADEWKHTFTDLPKYDEEGNEIEYTADETESEKLSNYRKTIEGTKIKNTYIGPVISQTKEIETEYNNTYVIQGERITYKVIVTNRGEMGKEVTIKDSIPEGTTFEEGSIRVNDQEEYKGINYSTKTKEDLTSTGIQVNVQGTGEGVDETVTLSFDVIVNDDATGNVSNIATVDEKETNKVEKPIVEFEKLATVERTNPESELEENQVTVKDIINYTIRVRNTGTIDTGKITVKDNVPEGTQAKEIKGEGSLKGNEITWTIDNIGAEQVKEVGFKAEVEYIREDGVVIENVATVNGKATNKTENPYVKPEPTIETTLQKDGTGKITSKAEKVSYEIEYRATIRDFNGKAKITIVDNLPYPIDKNNSNLAEGEYNPKDHTITWEEEIEGIDTFTTGEAKEIIRRKTIELKFEYGSLNGTSGTMTNIVNTKIELQEPTKENPEQYETVKDKEDEAEKETIIEIPAEVLVHHYIYDEEKDERTTVKIADDVLMRGFVGKDYQTEVAEVPVNYECIDTKPEKCKGKYEEDQIVVIYYYKLIKPELNNNMEKTATANKVDSEGKAVLTKENGVITYNIRYTVNVDKYIGKATIEIVDTLPAKLDLGAEGINLQKGEYNEENNTITWKEEITGIDTFSEGQARNIVIEKIIKVVYKEQDLNIDLNNTVKGTAKLYYPEDKSNRPGEELETVEGTDEETVKQEYLTKLIVEKEWDDSDSRKRRRPESILIDVKEIPSNKVTTVELNEGNGWRNEQDGLRKYDEAGEKITYEVTEKEKNPKDLEFYEEPQYRSVESQDEERTTYVFTITNEYKLKETDLNTTLTKTGTKEIKTSKDIVEYTITFTADISDYMGEGKVRIVDYLPYKIDESVSDTANGTYNDDAQTITWEEPVEYVNTFETGSKHIEITKTIRVLYKDIDLTKEKMTNNVTGKIELFENDAKDEKETTYDTDINVNGKVIVRFLDKETGEDIVNKVVDENGETIEERYNYEETGKVGDEYVANEKDIENYDYVETEGEKTGRITEEDTEIIHYYVRSKAKVIVKYVERTTEIDEEGNKHEVLKELLPDEIINGQVFDEYETEEKKIENYRFVESTDNTKGNMTKEDIVVIYYYEKIPSKVTVKYVEKTTETDEDGNEHEVLKELLPEDVIESYAGDEYETERKEVKNYRPAEPEPENAKGNMQEEPTEVIYYYERIPSGILSVKYVDIDTGKTIIKIKDEMTPEEKEQLDKLLGHNDEENNEQDNEETNLVETYDYEITGYVGDEYETEQKEIPYYIFVESTENTKGELTEEGDTVIYYYRKQVFNVSVNKYIENVTLNGENIRYNNNKFMKQEIVGTMINSSNLRITYGIEVKNTGEIDGTARIKDTIPEGFNIVWTDESFTKVDNNNIEAEVNLKTGESKVLKLTVEWVKNKDNFGEKTNIVSIVETNNVPGFKDTNTDDNTSEAKLLLSIKTGINNKVVIAISIFIVLSIITETVYLMKTRKIRIADIKREITRLLSK